MRFLFAALCAVLVCAAAGCGGSTATPTHVAAVFVDGIDHGDYRQACSVWQSGRKRMAACEAYIAMLTVMGGGFDWKIVPHSAKVDGDTATVQADTGSGRATIQLARTDAGWLVVQAS